MLVRLTTLVLCVTLSSCALANPDARYDALLRRLDYDKNGQLEATELSTD